MCFGVPVRSARPLWLRSSGLRCFTAFGSKTGSDLADSVSWQGQAPGPVVTKQRCREAPLHAATLGSTISIVLGSVFRH